ncbi:MAG: biopolymer transporter ExbD [Candidatus Omnitrophica bacterium]|nr:biopolymer transporter ExbD [Candidatus Omnitrophota bacterium]
MRFKRRYSIIKGALNITPLIDMVFLQLIYFMLTSSFIIQPGLKINLPRTVTTEVLPKNEITVSISAKGTIFYNDAQVTIEQLERLFFEETVKNADTTLLIKGDEKTEYGIAVTVMDTARKRGINKIAVATTSKF